MSGYTGWEFNEADRERLREQFPPRYPDFVGHHVTAEFGVGPRHFLPGGTLFVVGEVYDDARGVQALVVEVCGVDGPTTTRPDGKTYHVTWSLDRARGARPMHSNDVLANGFTRDWLAHSVSPEPKFFVS